MDAFFANATLISKQVCLSGSKLISYFRLEVLIANTQMLFAAPSKVTRGLKAFCARDSPAAQSNWKWQLAYTSAGLTAAQRVPKPTSADSHEYSPQAERIQQPEPETENLPISD